MNRGGERTRRRAPHASGYCLKIRPVRFADIIRLAGNRFHMVRPKLMCGFLRLADPPKTGWDWPNRGVEGCSETWPDGPSWLEDAGGVETSVVWAKVAPGHRRHSDRQPAATRNRMTCIL